MTARINPGDLCLIVGSNPGREENIGATVTVTDVVPEWVEAEKAWQFEGASRPLKIGREGEGREVISYHYVSNSADHPEYYTYLMDKHLMPIHPDADVMTQETIERLSI